ncbi:MAG: bifunctional phosphoribosylaminoimidazolecarboxamide formyltransferase/IMP cyclohydrolase [Pseudomonadota bacterium]
MSDTQAVRRALISVSDKRGLADLGQALAARGVELLSTGGSARTLADAGVPVTEVSAHTGFPEVMDGRVKTLHPSIHGGILARRDNPGDQAAMSEHAIAPIDLVVVNLYPFRETVASGAAPADCIENIDIGGPALIRAAAKNHPFVTVVTDPGDYQAVLDELAAHEGATTLALRQRLAAAAYAHTAAYDAAIAHWMAAQQGEAFPAQMSIPARRAEVLRYGENPHQTAAFYLADGGPVEPRPGVATARQLQGKALSYNNLNDTDAAFELAAEFDQPAVAIIKHANPCGAALGTTQVEAYLKALSSDPVSAFGGIVALNRSLEADTAAEISKLFVEVIIAPEVSDGAIQTLAKKENVRLLVTGAMPDPAAGGMTMKALAGGLLLQSRDDGRTGADDIRVVTKRAPDARELADLIFAFQVAKHVKSNAIVYVKDGLTVGIGAGQMSRVDSARIAALKSREAVEASGGTRPGTDGSVVASDAFFPFADGLMAAVEAGATAVIQPGGSMRDNEVIAAADDAGLAMVFTGQRHFRH